MASTLIDIEKQAALLPPSDRAKLAEFLLESLQAPTLAAIEQEWEQEIARRIEVFEKGETATFSAEDVFAEARRLLQ